MKLWLFLYLCNYIDWIQSGIHSSHLAAHFLMIMIYFSFLNRYISKFLFQDSLHWIIMILWLKSFIVSFVVIFSIISWILIIIPKFKFLLLFLYILLCVKFKSVCQTGNVCRLQKLTRVHIHTTVIDKNVPLIVFKMYVLNVYIV